jgi:lysophospholipase L1-like esterase
MTMSSRTLRSALGALVLVATAFLGLTSASASPRTAVRYDALGDSYASGYGVGPYDGPCGRSQSAYAVQLEGRMKVHLDDFVACAGATTATLVSGGQLRALDGATDLVTVQIGGNDVGWSSAVGACLGGTDAQCAGALAAARGKVSGLLPARLDSVYDQISADAPHAKVLVVGYPRLFSPAYGAYLLASPAEQQALNDGADLLRDVVAAAAARHGFDFVDVTKRFDDHGVNAPEPWVLGPFSGAPFHPNADGYAAYTAAVTAAVHPSQLPK